MARRARRAGRKFRRYLRGQIDHILALGTLGPNTLVSGTNTDAVTEKAWLSSVVAAWALKDMTAASDQGPILCGIAHSDYTDAEIEEWVENSESWEAHDLIGQEVAKRRIKRVGMFPGTASTTTAEAVLNDGRPVRTKCGWMLGTGQTIKFWAYNTGIAALATTVPDMHVQGHANLWPA